MQNNDITFLPKLTPHTCTWIGELLENRRILFDTIKKYESPVNIHCTTNYKNNILEYQETFSKLGLKNKIYFARKANKSIIFPKVSYKLGEGVDTASYREVLQCLEYEIHPDAIVCTAAVKNRKLLELLVDNDIEVVLDNDDEIQLLNEITKQKNKLVKVTVRVGGIKHKGETIHSRFGFSLDQAYALISDRIANPKDLPFFKYVGLHFHLNGYDIRQRANALYECYNLVKKLKATGIKTESLDMGGGILMNYLKDEQEWLTFDEELKRAVLQLRNEITYQNDGLGYMNYKGKIINNLEVYPYYNKINKGDFLKKILTTKFHNIPLYKLLAELDIEMRMEPGRSLLDQCGITVAKVAFRKYDSANNLLIGLEMNRTQLRSSSADYLLDPVHLSSDKRTSSNACSGYLVGAYCLEQELILKRKIAFNHMPDVGDMFVFVNTAGYMMHFYESEAHLFPLARNLVYDDADRSVREDG